MDLTNNQPTATPTRTNLNPSPDPVSAALQAQIAPNPTAPPSRPATTPSSTLPPSHTRSWTLSGYPIVDNKYHDLSTGEIKAHSGPSTGGPPSISVYWQNRLATGRRDQFHVISKTVASTANLSEYIIRMGDLLRKGLCKVDAMNVTRFDVYVAVESELGQQEFRGALEGCGLL